MTLFNKQFYCLNGLCCPESYKYTVTVHTEFRELLEEIKDPQRNTCSNTRRSLNKHVGGYFLL